MKTTMTLNGFKKNIGGFTLIELVMTILLIGILSIGLYEVVMWGISDYIESENYLHQANSMSLAVSVMRRNISNAAKPTSLIPGSNNGQTCYINDTMNPYNQTPIVVFNLASQSVTSPVNAVAFYKYIIGSTKQELVVFCVYNNTLYKQVTTATATALYPGINDVGANTSFSEYQATTLIGGVVGTMYYYYINMDLVSSLPSGYSENGGASVIIANPQ